MVQMKVRISLSQGFFPLLFSSLIILSLVGCAQENDISTNGGNRQLSFSVTTSGWNRPDDSLSPQVGSRALPISGTTFDTSESFNMIADQNDGSGNYSTLIDKEPVSYSNNIWKTTKDYYWSGNSNKTVSFYAYYPTDISKNISHTAGSAPTLSYTVPDDVDSQPDIIVASKTNVAGNTTTSTDLTFNHIFAAVKFKSASTGLPSGSNTTIKVKNVQYKGTYIFGSGWTNYTDTKDFSITTDLSTFGTAADITNSKETLMMLPQTFSNITIELIYDNGLTLNKTISGTWTAGNVYTYNLSKTISSTFDYTGGVQTFTAPYTGIYKLEVWGAQGGKSLGFPGPNIGLGGYSYGNIKLDSGTKLYICIGATGNSSSGGYNGGYAALSNGGAGGGATHIATTNRGILSKYSDYQGEVLIVAGGGGGVDNTTYYSGSGGGLTGGDGSSGVTGGTQTAGGSGTANGSFGQGGITWSSFGDYGAAGGGGWYGGGGTCITGGGAGGGSGHLGSTLISGTTGMQTGVRSGNGYARITFVSAD
jgi:hypothetical protein